MSGDDRDFFISYTGADEAWALWVAGQLEGAGYRTTVQAWDFDPGNFLKQMEDAVRNCARVLPILSEAYLRSKYGRQEWSAYYHQNDKLVIPVRVEDIETRSLLLPQQRINLVGRAEEDARKRLLDGVRKLAGPAAHPPLHRHPAPFPGLAARLVPAAPDHEAWGVGVRRTIDIDRAQLRLVVLGAGDAHRAAALGLRPLLRIAAEHELNLYDHELPPGAQLDRLTGYLDELAPEDASDVVVAFAGPLSTTDPALGVRLGLHGGALLPLAQLLDRLQERKNRVRVHVIVDATGAEQPIDAPRKPPVPVLMLGGSGGLAELTRRLTWPLDEEARASIPHRGSLALVDLRAIVPGAALSTGREEGSAQDIGLVPNPLAWPPVAPDTGPNWCFVASESDHEQEIRLVFEQTAQYPVLETPAGPVELSAEPGMLNAGDLLRSPAEFAAAVDQVCRAEIAVFDLTNFEPAVMILLGVRAVIRRGVTVCVTGVHLPPWDVAEPPFHLREISPVRKPTMPKLRERIRYGLRQHNEAGDRYTDLPCFELVRGVPPKNERRRRAFDSGPDSAILALVPFDPQYTERNWPSVRDNLQAAAADGPAPRRTLDLDSPRVISAQLFEAIRLTDFCLVDITGARPNVMFELGVRLAADELHPVVVVDEGFPVPGAASAWWAAVQRQWKQAQDLLVAIRYNPKAASSAFKDMVDRHLELSTLQREPDHPRARTALAGLPPAGVYDLAWRHAAAADEAAVTPVADRLRSTAETLLVDQTAGRRHLVYPKEHGLAKAAERCGREHLVAAFLYRYFRDRSSDEALGNRLINLLDESGDAADAQFARKIEEWLGGAEGGGTEQHE